MPYFQMWGNAVWFLSDQCKACYFHGTAKGSVLPKNKFVIMAFKMSQVNSRYLFGVSVPPLFSTLDSCKQTDYSRLGTLRILTRSSFLFFQLISACSLALQDAVGEGRFSPSNPSFPSGWRSEASLNQAKVPPSCVHLFPHYVWHTAAYIDYTKGNWKGHLSLLYH